MSELFSRFTKVVILSAVLCLSSGLLCQTPATMPQPYKPHLTFDVVSIREYYPHHSMRGPATDFPFSGYYEADGATIPQLIVALYHVRFYQILNMPSWAQKTMYTIVGKSDPSMDETLLKLSEADAKAEKRHMIEQMLAERFHLQMHSETRIATTYELVATERTRQLITPVPVGSKP
jgi:uncharacterized protein (TIGR03435 family)